MKRILRALALSAALVAAGAWNAQALTIYLDPTSATVGVNDSVTVDLYAKDFAPLEVVTTFDVDIGFDDSTLGFGDYTLGGGLGVPDPFWGMSAEAWDVSSPYLGGNTVNVAELSFLSPSELLSLQSDPLLLATLAFESSLSSGSQPVSVNFTINDSYVGTEVVPEPGTLLLLGTGLAGVAGWRRRRSS